MFIMFYYFPFILCLSAAAVSYDDEPHLTCLDDRTSENDCKDMTAEKVSIQLYYETLCPYCQRFDTGPLYEVFRKIGSHLDLRAYPFGNGRIVKEDGEVTITCQHGEEECYGNKLHACAIDILRNKRVSFFFNSCMMDDRRSTDEDADYCGKQMNIDPDPIKQCAKSDKAQQLHEYYGYETKKKNATYVPWVIINGKLFDLHFDLMKTVCEEFKNPPPECSSE